MRENESDILVGEITALYHSTRQAIEDSLNLNASLDSTTMLITHSAVAHRFGVYTTESSTSSEVWVNLGKALVKKMVEVLLKLATLLDALLKRLFSRVAFKERSLNALSKLVIEDIKKGATYAPSVVRVTAEMTGVVNYAGKEPTVIPYADVITAITAEASLTNIKSFSELILDMSKVTQTTSNRLPATVRADVSTYERRAMMEVEAMVLSPADIAGGNLIKSCIIKPAIGPESCLVKFDSRPEAQHKIWSTRSRPKEGHFPKTTVRTLTPVECKRILSEAINLLRANRELSGFFTLSSELASTLKDTANFLEDVSRNEAMTTEARNLSAELASSLGTWEALFRNVNHAKISNTLAIASSVGWWVTESMKGVKYE